MKCDGVVDRACVSTLRCCLEMGAVLQLLGVAPEGWAAVLAANVTIRVHKHGSVRAVNTHLTTDPP